VKLSQLKGIEVQAVADALEIHPFMLSRWRKEARDGVLRGRVSVPSAVKQVPPAREMKRFQTLQRAHAVLQEEHALLKNLIRFTSARNRTYAWRQRPASARTRQDRVTTASASGQATLPCPVSI